MYDHMTDAELIAASAGQPSFFGEVFLRHYGCVYAFVARRLGRNDAADVAADVFLKAFRLRLRYDPERECCLPWLYGIAYNAVGDRLRKQRRINRVFVHQYADAAAPAVEDAENRLLAAPVGTRLNKALSRLSKGDRDAFLLYALEGLSYSEVGVILDIPTGTVGSRIARARRRIRKAIPDLDQITDRMGIRSGDQC